MVQLPVHRNRNRSQGPFEVPVSGDGKEIPQPASHMPQCIKEYLDSWWTCVVILCSVINEWNVFSGWGEGQEALVLFISKLLNSKFSGSDYYMQNLLMYQS